MGFTEELAALTEEREALNDRIDAAYEKQGIPREVPLIAREGDEEMMTLVRDTEDLKEREAAFWERYKDR